MIEDKLQENNQSEENNREKKINVKRTYVLKSGTVVVEPFSMIPLIMLALLIVSFVAAIFTNVNIGMFFRNIGNFFDILYKMFPPNFPYIEKVWGPMVDTIKMALLGSMLGGVFALPVALFASSNIIKNRYIILSVRFLLSLLRTLPVLVYAMLLTLIFGFGPFAGTIAISIFTFAIVSKMLYEKIETIDMGAFIAVESTGANKVNSFTTAVLPQIMPNYLSIVLYSFEINIRYAAILGYVGAGGIGLLLNDRMSWRLYQDVIVVLLVLLIVVISIESVSRYIRKRLN